MKKDKLFFHGHSRLAEERLKIWETQQDAADYFGVSRVTWGQCERGNATPSGDVLAGLAQKGADVLYILTGTRSGIYMSLSEVRAASGRADPSSFKAGSLSKRAAALIANYEAADDAGKKLIEGTAAMAASSPKREKKTSGTTFSHITQNATTPGAVQVVGTGNKVLSRTRK